VGLERVPLSLMSTTEGLLERKSSTLRYEENLYIYFLKKLRFQTVNYVPVIFGAVKYLQPKSVLLFRCPDI
jgi:hypothetical protein